MDIITRKELIELLLTLTGLILTIIIPVVGVIVKIAVDKAKLQSIEGDRALEKEMKEIRDNYLLRFEEIRKDLLEIRILIENKFNLLEKKIIENRK